MDEYDNSDDDHQKPNKSLMQISVNPSAGVDSFELSKVRETIIALTNVAVERGSAPPSNHPEREEARDLRRLQLRG